MYLSLTPRNRILRPLIAHRGRKSIERLMQATRVENSNMSVLDGNDTLIPLHTGSSETGPSSLITRFLPGKQGSIAKYHLLGNPRMRELCNE